MSVKGPAWKSLQKAFVDEWENAIDQGKEIPEISRVYFANSEDSFVNALNELLNNVNADKKYFDMANQALVQLNKVASHKPLPHDEVMIFADEVENRLYSLPKEPKFKQSTTNKQDVILKRLGELRAFNSDLEELGKGMKSLSDVKKAHNIPLDINPYQHFIGEMVRLYHSINIDITDKSLDKIYQYQDLIDKGKILSKAAGITWQEHATFHPLPKIPTGSVKQSMPAGLVEYEQSIWRDLQKYEEEYKKAGKLNFKSEINKADLTSQKQQIAQIKRELLGKYLAYEGPNKNVIRDEAKRVADSAIAQGLFKREEIPTFKSWSHPSARTEDNSSAFDLDKVLKVAQDFHKMQADKVKQQGSLKSAYKDTKKRVLSTFNIKHDTKLALSKQLSSDLSILRGQVAAGIVNSKDVPKQVEAILDKAEKAANKRISVGNFIDKDEFKNFIKTMRNEIAQEPVMKYKKRD